MDESHRFFGRNEAGSAHQLKNVPFEYSRRWTVGACTGEECFYPRFDSRTPVVDSDVQIVITIRTELSGHERELDYAGLDD